MILARKIVKLRKAELDRRSVAFGIPYRFYVGIKNGTRDFIEQNRVFGSLGEDLGSPTFLALEIIELEKCKLDGRSSGFGVPYRFYLGIKTEFLDFIE